MKSAGALRSDRLGQAASVAAMAMFALLAVQQFDKPLQLDDVDHFGIAKAISETGIPKYYRGEAAAAMSGALHPPLNDYLLAGWFLLFGAGVDQARSYGLLWILLHGGVVVLLMKTLFPPATVARWHPWFWALFLLNPYTVQMSLMVDIDSSSYGPFLALLLWSVVRLWWWQGSRRSSRPKLWEFALIALLVAICLWLKLTTVLLVLPFVFLLLLPRMKLLPALASAAAVYAAGVALFLASFWLACSAWGLLPETTFRFAVANATGGGHLPSLAKTLARMLAHNAKWTGVLPWLIAAVALAASARRAVARAARDSPAWEVMCILLVAIATNLYYCATRLNFAGSPYKYTFVFFGVVTAALAYFVSGSDAAPAASLEDDPHGRRRLGLLALAGCSLLLGWWVAESLRDAVIQFGWKRGSALLVGLPALVGAFACVAVAAGGALARSGWRRVLLAAALFHLGLQAGVSFYQSRVEYSTTYDYGQRGLVETAEFVRTHTRPDDLISSMKDLGLLAERRYIENYGAVYGPPAQAQNLIKAWESGEVALIVFTEGRGQDRLAVQPLLRDWISREATLVESFGDYRIYRSKRLAPPAPHRPS